MFKSRFLCGGSALAVSVALTVTAYPASAQNQPPAAAPPTDPKEAALQACVEAAGDNGDAIAKCFEESDITVMEVVKSTGTLIAGQAEDAALPVEVTTREDLLDRGSPSVTEMVRSLSEVGAVQGENNLGATGYGNTSVNLRGLGSGRTLALINGRRMADSPVDAAVTSGNFQDLSGVPMAALQQVEVLKDGGTATYGADAVAGVVNFIPRRDLDGFEISGRYRIIEDTDGDWESSILWGKRGDVGDILISLEHQHRSKLSAADRWFADGEPYLAPRTITSGQYVAGSNPGAYQMQIINANGSLSSITSQGTTALNTAVNPAYTRYVGGLASQGATGSTVTDNTFPVLGTPAANLITAPNGTFRDPLCDELGGIRGFGTTGPLPICYFNSRRYQSIVNETDNTVLFASTNFDVTDAIQFHSELSLQRQRIHVDTPPSPTPSQAPCNYMTPLATFYGSTSQNAISPGTCTTQREVQTPPTPATAAFVTASTTAYFAPGYNPAVADFLGRFYNLAGTTRAVTPEQYRNITGITNALPGSGPVSGAYALTGGDPRLSSFLAGFPTTQVNQWDDGGLMTLPITLWRPFAQGGNPLGNDWESFIQENTTLRTVQQVKVDFGSVFGVNLDLDVSGSYTRTSRVQDSRGILVERLQRALNGFATNLDDPGGDICTAEETTGVRLTTLALDPDGTGPLLIGDPDGTYPLVGNGLSAAVLVPFTVGAGGGAGDAANGYAPVFLTDPDFIRADPDGTFPPTAINGPHVAGGSFAGNGCYFFNPFGTALAGNPELGLTTPVATPTSMGYVGTGDYQGYTPGMGLANAPGIARWLYEERSSQTYRDSVLAQAILRGDAGPFELPGGPIGWAFGLEHRWSQREQEYDLLSNRLANPCQWRHTGGGDVAYSPGVNEDNLTLNALANCSTQSGPFIDGFGGTPSVRRTANDAIFAEVALPFLERFSGGVSYRWEREKTNGRQRSDGVGVFAGNLRYRVSPNLQLRFSASETFDPIEQPNPNTTLFTQFGGSETAENNLINFTGTSTVKNAALEIYSHNNENLGPEQGYNFNVGVIWSTPDRRLQVTLDYFNIEITGEPESITSSNLLRALIGQPDGQLDPTVPIDCTTSVAQAFFADFRPELALPGSDDPMPFVAFTDGNGNYSFGCRPGRTTINGDTVTGEALAISYLNQVNAGETGAQGIDASLEYRFPTEFLGGTWRARLDGSFNLYRRESPTFLLGIQIANPDDLLGQNTGLGYNIWRGSLELTYTRGNHTFNLFTRGNSSLFADSDVTPVVLSTSVRNWNPGVTGAIGGSGDLRLQCANAFLPTQDGGANQSLVGPVGAGEAQYNAQCNVPFINVKLPAIFNTDFTWRWRMPERQASLSVSVNNVFDRAPPFYAAGFGYDTSGPLSAIGRNVTIGFNKSF